MSVLLVSSDSDLAAAVQSAAASLRGCDVRWLSSLDGLGDNLLDESICLAIMHISSAGAQHVWDAIVRRTCSLQPRIATLVIRDVYDGEHDLWCHRTGVRECITRPLDLGRLTYLIDALTIRSRLNGVRAAAPKPLKPPADESASPVMRRLLYRARRLSTRDVSILLHGETGAGKTYLARWIHDASPRASRPFVSVNCGSLPANLVESELFGHKKGAFTGADDDRVGKFAYAQDGTLLLDEVDALSLAAQAMLLRVLDEGVFEPVGCNKSLPFRGRLIAASNRALDALVEKGDFRADLYYRLNVVQFSVPALRHRVEEIRPLMRRFVEKVAKNHGERVPAIDEQVWSVLERYEWPGNLRELRNTVEYALTECEGSTLGLEHLPPTFQQAAKSEADRPFHGEGGNGMETKDMPRKALAQARQMGEYRYLVGVLNMCGNNRTEAARQLGISRTALYKKLMNLGIV
jgi:DNA-binding NtrC family response regulator